MPDCGVGLSRQHDGASAAREAVELALRRLGDDAATVLLFATTAYADPRPLVDAASEAAGDARLVGCTAAGVLTNEAEIEDEPGVAALALGDAIVARPFAFAGQDAAAVIARATAGLAPGLVALLADGYSTNPDRLAGAIAGALPATLPLVGGLATGPAGVAPAYRFLDGEISSHGAAGLVIAAPAEPLVGVAHGCRPVSPVMTVTSARGNVIATLDHRPAFEAFASVARPLLDDLPRAAQTVFLAVPAAAHSHDQRADDRWDDTGFVVRGLLRFDPERGLLASSEPLADGTPVRFVLRDAVAARAELHRVLDDLVRRLDGRTPRFGLYFDCAGRGRALFGVDDHDVSFVQSALGRFPLCGMFGGGEIGPLRGACRLNLFSGVLALVP